LKENCYSPDSGYEQLFAQNQFGVAHDLKVASKSNPNFRSKDLKHYLKKILNQE
jgi:hypothetical protein